MGNRIRWILVAYLTNRVFLTALLLASLWLGAVTWFNYARSDRYQSNLPPAPRGELLVYSVDSLDEVRRLGLQDQVDAINLGNLWTSMEMARQKPQSGQPGFRYSIGPPPDSFYDVLDEFPNLRIVELGFHDTTRGIERLAALRQLTYLKTDFGPIDLAMLGSLKTLKRLEPGSHQPVKNIAALAALPRLETLILATDQGLTAENFAELARLPQLKTLGIRISFGSHTLHEKELAQLGASRTLKTLYVGGNNLPSQLNLLAQARTALPAVDVRPALVRTRPPLMAYFPPTLLAMAVGFVIASQFRNAAMQLAPRFALDHLSVGIGWCLLVGLAVAASIKVTGTSLAASVLITTAMLAISLAGGVELFIQRKLGLVAAPNRWSSGAQAIAIFGVLFSLFRPPTSNGISAWLLWVLAGVGLWSAVRAANLLRSLPSLSGTVQQQPPALWGGTYRPGWWFATSTREQSIEHLPRAVEVHGFWQRVQRRRAGNQPRLSLTFALFMVVSAAVMTLMLILLLDISAKRPEFIRTQAAALSFVLLMGTCGQIAVGWRKRLTVLDVESLRPISRSVMQREFAAALAVDLVTPALVFAAIAAVAINLPPVLASARPWEYLLNVSWSHVPGDFAVLAVVIWTICCAVCGIWVIVERAWLQLLLMCSIVALMTFATVGCAALVDDLPRSSPGFARALVPYLWIPVLISAAVAAWMWQLWTRMEFDRQR